MKLYRVGHKSDTLLCIMLLFCMYFLEFVCTFVRICHASCVGVYRIHVGLSVLCSTEFGRYLDYVLFVAEHTYCKGTPYAGRFG